MPKKRVSVTFLCYNKQTLWIYMVTRCHLVVSWEERFIYSDYQLLFFNFYQLEMIYIIKTQPSVYSSWVQLRLRKELRNVSGPSGLRKSPWKPPQLNLLVLDDVCDDPPPALPSCSCSCATCFAATGWSVARGGSSAWQNHKNIKEQGAIAWLVN